MGLIDQLKSPLYYYKQIDMQELISFVKSTCAFDGCVKKPVFLAINTIQYGGNTLKELKSAKHKALMNADLLKTVQGFRPRVKFKFKSD